MHSKENIEFELELFMLYFAMITRVGLYRVENEWASRRALIIFKRIMISLVTAHMYVKDLELRSTQQRSG